MDHRQHFFADAYEIGTRLDGARVTGRDEAAAEIEFVFVRNLAGARGHHNEVGGEEQCLFHAVRDEEHHLAGAMPHVEDQFLYRLAGERIEGTQRLVHQQDRGIGGQCAGDPHTLLHATRQFVDRALRELGEPDQLQFFKSDAAPFGCRDTTHA